MQSTAINRIYTVFLAIEDMVAESRPRLPPLIGVTVTRIYSDMVIVGELTKTVQTFAAVTVNAPYYIAFAERS